MKSLIFTLVSSLLLAATPAAAQHDTLGLSEADYVAFRGRLERGGFLDGKHALLSYPLHDDDLEKIERLGPVRPWQETLEML